MLNVEESSKIAIVLVSDLLDLEELHLKVRAGNDALARPIRWVHTTELIDPSLYLQGGELILTTGVWRKRSDDERRFVRALVRADASGLVYGLPKPQARTPPGLAAECERHHLPLLEASFELPFVRISEAFVSTITDELQASLLRTIRRNAEFVDLIAGGRGSGAILRAVAQEQGRCCWLLGPSGRVVESTSPRPSAEETRDVWQAIPEATYSPLEITLKDGTPRSIFPVCADSHVTGYLVIEEHLGELGSNGRTAIEQALSFLGLESRRLHAERVVSDRFAREVLDLVALGESRALEVASRLRAFGLDPQAPMAIMVVAIAEIDGRETECVAELAEWFFTEHDLPAVLPTEGREIVAIANVADAGQVRALAESLFLALSDDVASHRVAVGVGAPVSEPARLRRCLVEARHASRLATLKRSRAAVSTSDEIGSHSLLLALQEDDLLRTFQSAILGPLVDHDARRGSGLRPHSTSLSRNERSLARGCGPPSDSRQYPPLPAWKGRDTYRPEPRHDGEQSRLLSRSTQRRRADRNRNGYSVEFTIATSSLGVSKRSRWV